MLALHFNEYEIQEVDHLAKLTARTYPVSVTYPVLLSNRKSETLSDVLARLLELRIQMQHTKYASIMQVRIQPASISIASPLIKSNLTIALQQDE